MTDDRRRRGRALEVDSPASRGFRAHVARLRCLGQLCAAGDSVRVHLALEPQNVPAPLDEGRTRLEGCRVGEARRSLGRTWLVAEEALRRQALRARRARVTGWAVGRDATLVEAVGRESLGQWGRALLGGRGPARRPRLGRRRTYPRHGLDHGLCGATSIGRAVTRSDRQDRGDGAHGRSRRGPTSSHRAPHRAEHTPARASLLAAPRLGHERHRRHRHRDGQEQAKDEADR